MSLEVVEEWYENLPEYERSLPLVIVDGTAYSPNEVLQEVRSGSTLGEQLQSRVERREFGTPLETKKELAKQRLKQILEERPVDVVALTRPTEAPEKSASQLQTDIDEGRTEFAKNLIEQETEYIERIRSK